MTDQERMVELRWDENIVTVQLNRPNKLNALSTVVEQQIIDALGTPEVQGAGAIVFMGHERAFSAGADTGELPDMSPEHIAAYYRASGALYSTVAHLQQPTVAAVSGYCLGAGFELALACDIRVAATNTQFGLPELSLGILASSGGLTRVVRALGPAVAREILLLGERFDAARAKELNLVLETVEFAQLTDAALHRARQLADQPRLAYAWTNAAIDAVAESSTSAALLIEQLAYAALNRGRSC